MYETAENVRKLLKKYVEIFPCLKVQNFPRIFVESKVYSISLWESLKTDLVHEEQNTIKNFV